MLREIVRIDKGKCNGCGLCVPNCHEGALQIIDGKARLISELMCDGLGACLGYCPEGAITIENREAGAYDEASDSDRHTPVVSELTQWPVQMHLINPSAAYFEGADLLVAADCVAFTHGDFHRSFLAGKKLVIACPKLDHSKEIYIRKLIRLIDEAKVNTITVIIMEVPCCGGLVQMVQEATTLANRRVPVKVGVVSIRGEVRRPPDVSTF